MSLPLQEIFSLRITARRIFFFCQVSFAGIFFRKFSPHLRLFPMAGPLLTLIAGFYHSRIRCLVLLQNLVLHIRPLKTTCYS